MFSSGFLYTYVKVFSSSLSLRPVEICQLGQFLMFLWMINKCDFFCNVVVAKFLHLIEKSRRGGFHSLSFLSLGCPSDSKR